MRVVLILVLIMLVAGCRSKYELISDKLEQSDRNEQISTIESEQAKKDSTGTSVKTIEHNRNEDREAETEIKVTEYDTSKPVVAETGKPPVLRETVTTKKEKKKEQVNTSGKEVEANTTITHTDRATEIQQDTHGTKKAISNIHETRTRKIGEWWFWYGAGVIIALGYWTLKRLHK